MDEISDPFAPPDPKDPFAYSSTENSKSLSFPPVRFSLAAKRFDEITSSDEDESETESDTADDDDSGEETESEHPVVKAGVDKGKGKKQDPPMTNSSFVTDTTNSDPSSFRTLYIAMEFVDNVSCLIGSITWYKLTVSGDFAGTDRQSTERRRVVATLQRGAGCLVISPLPEGSPSRSEAVQHPHQ